MKLLKTALLNVGITVSCKEDILSYIKDFLQMSQSISPVTIFTPNPEMIVEAQKNEEFRQTLNSADINLPDGVGIVWAGKILSSQLAVHSSQVKESTLQKKPLQTLQRIPGVDFMEELVKIAAEKGYSIGLIGGRRFAADYALHNLQRLYPGLQGWAQTPEEFKIRKNELVACHLSLVTKPENTDAYFRQLALKIRDSGVRLVCVGLGAPKQEFFIQELAYHLSLVTYHQVILMSIGGALDIFAGNMKRAPKFMRNINLEWLWRLMCQPWRIRRQFKLISFILLILNARFVLKSTKLINTRL